MRTLQAVAAALFSIALLAGCAAPADEPAPATSAPDTNGQAVGGAPGSRAQSVFPGTYNFTENYSQVLTAGTLAILPGQRVVIPSPIDGADIEMGINRPDTTEKVPILVFASPYFYAEGSRAGTRTVLDRAGSFGSLITNYVPHGYAVVALAVRGTAGSDGCNDLMGELEIDDLDAAITWLGTQDWSSGAIAMTGVSYDGSTPWSVASRGNPYLKTIIPISGVPDIYGLMYRNGSSESRGPLLLNALYVAGSIQSGADGDIPNRVVCPEGFEGLALSGVAGAVGVDPTGYWQARNRKPGVEANYKGSVFSIQGLQDWNVDASQVVPWVDELESLGLETKQLLGQWNHAWPDGIASNGNVNLRCSYGDPVPTDLDNCKRADWKEILLRWLDKELKGVDVDTGPPVQVMDNAGRWRNEAHYPPHDANWTTFYLDGQALTSTPGAAASVPLLPMVAPLPPTPADDLTPFRVDYAEYALPIVDSPMLIAGLPKVHVTVTPGGAGGYIGAYLHDKAPGEDVGRLIGWTTMNLAFADGTTEYTPVVPGMPIVAKMEIQPMDAVLEPDHQLVLRIWVFTDGDRLPTIPPSPIQLEVGDARSTLQIPVIERFPDVYFMPPTPPTEAAAVPAP